MPEEKINLSEHQVYMDGTEGPFMCENCKYFSTPNRCTEKNIIKLAKQHKFGLVMIGLFARVDPKGCSDFFEKK